MVKPRTMASKGEKQEEKEPSVADQGGHDEDEVRNEEGDES